MKILFIALMFISSAHSQQREQYNAGLKQDLLSAAAAYGLEAQDINLLDSLKRANWNPSLIMGYMPNNEIFFPYSPMTFSAMLDSSISLTWLMEKGGVSLEDRDGNLDRAIDLLIENESNQKSLSIIKKNTKPIEADAIEELASKVYRKFAGSRNKLKEVNGKEPDKLWNDFNEHLEKMEAILKRRHLLEKKIHNLDSVNLIKNADLYIDWKVVGNNVYEFDITTSKKEFNGGGISGTIYFKYGYWLTKNIKSWDT